MGIMYLPSVRVPAVGLLGLSTVNLAAIGLTVGVLDIVDLSYVGLTLDLRNIVDVDLRNLPQVLLGLAGLDLSTWICPCGFCMPWVMWVGLMWIS